MVCTGYNIGGKETKEIPFRLDKHPVEAIYKQFPGWDIPSSKAKTFDELPKTMKSYMDFINNYLGVKIHYISNGPGRDQLVIAE
jgi:adenylosuccinate synthase